MTQKKTRHNNKKGKLEPQVRKVINEDISHYEENPGEIKTFIERMMVLGYTYDTIIEQTLLKYKMNKNLAEFHVKSIRNSWIAYGSLPDEEKRSVLEQQLNHLFRECLDKNEVGVAAIVMKRKMELAGIETSNKGKGSVNCNVNIGPQGITPEQILPQDLLDERNKKLLQVAETTKKKSE